MTVLIAVDSRHGSTTEIAEAIAEELKARNLDVELRSGEDVGSVTDYEGVVLGSAVYTGHWMKGARTLAWRERASLAERPVWLFSSGPIGDPLFPTTEPTEVEEIVRLTHARAHRVFPGKLDRHELGLVERTLVGVVHAKDGDFRDWDAVTSWANEIADVLAGPVAVEG